MARLPVYLRSLLELAGEATTTISSERLAEMAGVNAAKVRKDLSYLGSYGTRGVGYDVEYLLFQMSRELGLTQDWPVVIVGIGNLGQALANYGGLRRAGLPVAALVDADPAKVGERVGDLDGPRTRRPARARRRARHRHRRHRHARRRGPGRRRPAGRGRRRVDPELRPGGARRCPRRSRCARSTSPSSCRSSASTSSAGRRSRGRARPGRRPLGRPAGAARSAGRSVTPVATWSMAGRPCLVVGGGAVAAQKVRGLLDGGADVHGRRRRRRPTRCRRLAGVTVERAALPAGRGRRLPAGGHRHRRPGGQPAVFDDGEAAGVWVNSADDPANCTFTLPAVVRQGRPARHRVAPAAHSPALATWLRRRARGRARAGVRRRCSSCSPSERTRLQAAGSPTEGLDWQEALDSGMLDLVREGRLAEAKERLQACLSSSSD